MGVVNPSLDLVGLTPAFCLTLITSLVTLNCVTPSCLKKFFSTRDDETEIMFADGSGLELLHLNWYYYWHAVKCQENGVQLLANAAINPTARTVSNMYDIWRKEHFGSSVDPLSKLLEKVDYYRDIGTRLLQRHCHLVELTQYSS